MRKAKIEYNDKVVVVEIPENISILDDERESLASYSLALLHQAGKSLPKDDDSAISLFNKWDWLTEDGMEEKLMELDDVIDTYYYLVGKKEFGFNVDDVLVEGYQLTEEDKKEGISYKYCFIDI